ncbi:hypothetical protein [Sinomonas notoginsengisoli]|uniref:hypothetical protein n=1 Tax=Sinomonas notoginsengisoli TaxID=1457311 RepID=UPI001F159A3A|nr:hypothetical protein [Sinomonas notoginsengisoli]
MGLFKKHEQPAVEAEKGTGTDVPSMHAESGPGGHQAATRKPKREAHAFRQVPPWEMNEELAERIAMRAYGDEDHDGKPDIPARPFPGF